MGAESRAVLDKIWSDEQTAAGLYLEHTIQRCSEDMPQEVKNWFEITTKSVVVFDKELQTLLAEFHA